MNNAVAGLDVLGSELLKLFGQYIFQTKHGFGHHFEIFSHGSVKVQK